MKKHKKKRNWSQYNQKLQKIARIDFYMSENLIENWEYNGKRSAGGKKIYTDHVIEIFLIMKEVYKMAYRQTVGFVGSVLEMLYKKVQIPHYTTLSRRAAKLKVDIRVKSLVRSKEKMIVAVDSTGLSLYTETDWNRKKHKSGNIPGHEKWRKLHVGVDVKTGEILACSYTKSTVNDCEEFGSIIDAIDSEIDAVCGDMAYDTVNCRRKIYERFARQLIPPIRKANLSKNSKNIRKKDREILNERDEAINYINHNTINGNRSAARANWKEKVGYHVRSLAETTMFQIKSHCTDKLTNKLESTRQTQAKIKCKIINKIVAA